MASSLHLLAALIYLLPFWIHATPFLHASSFPAPLVRRQPPEIPTDIRGLVVNLLEDCPEALRELGLVCREFNDLTRPILFRNIHILSTNCLVELAALLESTWSTIPRNARNLIIHFDPPSFHGYRVEKQNSETIAIALTDIIIHFDIQRSAFLSFPGVFSRLLDWSYLGRWVNLRSLSVHGHYGYVAELTTTLAQLPLLESLVVSATFTSSTPSANLLASAGPPAFYNFLSPRLREITIASPGSLCLIPWMCSVGVGPENLHLLRVRVDNFDRHSNYFTHILPFLQRYGKQLTHLYAWLDDTLDSEMRVGEARSPCESLAPDILAER